MTRIKITLAFVLGFTATQAQQTPIYSQNFLNLYLNNPAAVAAKNETRFMLHHRQQWVGIQDAPRTSAITLETPLGGEKYALGLKINTDQVHIFNTTTGQVDFRYRLPITEDHLISFGLGGAFIQRSIDFNKVRVVDKTESNLLDYNSNQMAFDADFGLVYQWDKLTAGFSINQLMNSQFNYEDDISQEATAYNNLRHFNIFATYDFELSKKPITISPTLFVRHMQGANLPLEFNTVVKWDQKFWGGLGYRQNFGVVIIAGAQIFDQLILGYSYDLSTSGIKDYNSGTHEISIGYRIPRKVKGNQSRDQLARSIRNQQEEIDLLKDNNETLVKQVKEQEKALKEQKEEVNKLKSTYEKEKPKMDKIIEDNKVEPNTSTDEETLTNKTSELSEEDKERIDNLEKEIEALKSKLNEQKNNTKSLDSAEVMKAIEKELEALKVSGVLEEGDDERKYSKYYTVVGSYFNIEDAKAYQRMLKREAGVDTKVVSRADRKFFFVYTSEFNDLDAALSEIKQLKESELKSKINGNFWVHGRK